jgi:lipopolysaccharide transport system ATP-binding protein
MYVRLAFAVAAHLEPEILVVDEVLAVGDAQFQKKCLGKMGDVAKEGRTVLFVSHNMVAIQSLCSRALCLHSGNLVEDGMPHRVVANYMRDVSAGRLERTWNRASAPGNDLVKIQSIKILDESGKIPERLTVNDSFWIETRFWNLRAGTALGIAPHIFNQGGVLVFASVDFVDPDWGGKPLPFGLFSSRCHIPACLLNDGAYTITMLVYRDASVHVHWENEIIGFELHDTDDLRGNGYWKWPGVIRPSLEWKIEMVESLE